METIITIIIVKDTGYLLHFGPVSRGLYTDNLMRWIL